MGKGTKLKLKKTEIRNAKLVSIVENWATEERKRNGREDTHAECLGVDRISMQFEEERRGVFVLVCFGLLLLGWVFLCVFFWVAQFVCDIYPIYLTIFRYGGKSCDSKKFHWVLMETSLDILLVTWSKIFNCFLGTSLNVTAFLNQATKVSNYIQVSKRLYSKCNGEYSKVALIYFSYWYMQIYKYMTIYLFI